jgi:hypothetical protein
MQEQEEKGRRADEYCTKRRPPSDGVRSVGSSLKCPSDREAWYSHLIHSLMKGSNCLHAANGILYGRGALLGFGHVTAVSISSSVTNGSGSGQIPCPSSACRTVHGPSGGGRRGKKLSINTSAFSSSSSATRFSVCSAGILVSWDTDFEIGFASQRPFWSSRKVCQWFFFWVTISRQK